MTMPFSIQNLLPGKLNAGINLFHGVTGCQADLLEEFISSQVAAIRTIYNHSLPPGFACSRQLYKSFRIDPTKHRPSSEALWRRLRDKNDFPAVNPLVDLTNFLSLKFQICFGLYDLERVHGPAVITLGNENDHYQGIRKESLNFNGRIVLRDEQGAFGNPSSDSLRASVNKNSREVMQVLFFHPDDSLQKAILAETLTVFLHFFTMTKSRSFFI
ncbi:MAG TPA: phenylalanine--tRNA ligase beta subunit-related protein [Patescibacteria group bacterium]|nr:phenylalanine--tRNA ligase beta subunit-related protein [Patescibacteria group bacterium]